MNTSKFMKIYESIVPDYKGCRNWPLSLVCGYAQARVGQESRGNRVALTIKLGRPIGEGLLACHTCDNKKCIEMSHLYEGTRLNNVEDAKSRRRYLSGDDNPARKNPGHMASGSRNGQTTCRDRIPRGKDSWSYNNKDKVARGESHGSAKLTEAQVIEIRRRHEENGVPKRRLAREYGVGQSTVVHIINRKIWTHI